MDEIHNGSPEGDPPHQRFIELVQRHRDDLYRFLKTFVRNDHEVEEILQTALMNAWEKFHQLRDEERFPAWMRSICMTLYIRSLRTLARARKKHLGFYEEYRGRLPDSENPHWKRIKEERLEKIVELVRSLPDDSREVLELQYFQNLSLTEIAERLGISKSTVKQRLAKARQIFELKFKSLGDFFEDV